MTLVKRARSLDSVFRAAVDQDRMRIDVGRVTDLARTMGEAADALHKAAIAQKELGRTGYHLPPEDRSALAALQEELQAASSAVAADPMAGAGDELHKLVRRSSDDARRVTAYLADAWRRHMEDLSVPSVDEDFLELLERAGLDVGRLRLQVEGALSRLAIREARTLPAKGDVEALEHAVADLGAAVETLGSIVPPAVREFIVQASSQAGAPLYLLTEEVQAFLENTDLSNRYRIRQGRR